MSKIYSSFENSLFQELSGRLTPCKFSIGSWFLRTYKYLLMFKFLKRNLLENLFSLTLSIFQFRKRFLMQSSYLSVYSFRGSDSVHIKKGAKTRLRDQCFPRKFTKLFKPAIQQSNCGRKILRILFKRCHLIKYKIYYIGLYFNFIGKGF